MPCAAVARLFDRGRPGACEGDVLGAVSLLALQALSGGPTALMDLSHIAGDGLVFWHCGNAPKALAAEGVTRLETHFNRPEIGCVRGMRVASGEATMLRPDTGPARMRNPSERWWPHTKHSGKAWRRYPA